MGDDVIHPEDKAKAADNKSPLPLRVLLPRAIIAALIGGLAGKILATLWCYYLGRLLFPSVFPNGRGMISANMSVGLTMIGGALLGLVIVLARGDKWLRAFATVIGVWLGAIVCFMGVIPLIGFSYFLLTALPPDKEQPPLTVNDLKFGIWTFVPMIPSGGAVLIAVFKMHVSDSAAWFQEMRANFLETCAAIFKPQERHKLERFVLQSPLSPDECRARLPQIATVETSKFAFWEKLPLPGFKPLNVRVEGNRWTFASRYKRSVLFFQSDLRPNENGIQINCASTWSAIAKINFMWNIGASTLILAIFALAAICQVLAVIFGHRPTNFLPIWGFLGISFIWSSFIAMLRTALFLGRKQQLMIIEAMERILEAQIIERETVRYKWGLFEEKPNAPTAS